MDLVAGATGFVGKRIAMRLREEGRKVRAMVRGGATRVAGQELLDAGIEVADADVTRPATLNPACSGIENVICTVTSMPHGRDNGLRQVDHDGVLALIDAAKKSGVKKFVYTSYSGNIREDSPLETAKRDCEKRLLESGLEAVILRPSYFMEIWLSSALGFDPAKGTARIYGSGDRKVSYISATDVAEFAVRAVTKKAGGSVTLEMGGPEALSQLDAVKIFEEALGKKFSLEFLALDTLRAQHASSDPLQKTFAAITLGYASGDEIPQSLENARKFGVKLRSVKDYAATFRA